MKRKDAIKTIEAAGEIMDEIVIANDMSLENESIAGVTREEIRAMQSAMVVIASHLKDDEATGPLSLALEIVGFHGFAKQNIEDEPIGSTDYEVQEC